MLKIRLQRVGRIHEPSFRLVLTDSKNSSKSGRFEEILGSYDPRKSIHTLNADRIKYWLSQGAETTGTINNLLIKKKVIIGKKVNVSAKSKKEPAPKSSTASVESNPPQTPQVPAGVAPLEAATPTPTAPEAPVETPVESPKNATIEPVEEKVA